MNHTQKYNLIKTAEKVFQGDDGAYYLKTFSGTHKLPSNPNEGGVTHRKNPNRENSPTEQHERMLIGKEDALKNPVKKDEELVYKLMQSAKPHELKDVKVYSGLPDSEDITNRLFHNQRKSPLSEWQRMKRSLAVQVIPEEEQAMDGPLYDPMANSVNAPWKAPAATMHELGHAIDFNKSMFGSKVPENAIGRFAKNNLRDAYAHMPFTTIPKEMAAWRKGERALLEGAIKNELDKKKNKDFEKVKEIHEQAQTTKPPALGSYIGGSLGTLAGLGGSIAALNTDFAQDNFSTLGKAGLTGLGTILASMLGTSAGSAIGKAYSDSLSEEDKQNEFRKKLEKAEKKQNK